MVSSIMVMDKGSVIEFDTPKNLLDNKDSYFFSIAHSFGQSFDNSKEN